MTDEKSAALTIRALLAEPSFVDAMEFLANHEADEHLKNMRSYVAEEQALRAQVCEARAREWERLLVAFRELARKHQNGE